MIFPLQSNWAAMQSEAAMDFWVPCNFCCNAVLAAMLPCNFRCNAVLAAMQLPLQFNFRCNANSAAERLGCNAVLAAMQHPLQHLLAALQAVRRIQATPGFVDTAQQAAAAYHQQRQAASHASALVRSRYSVAEGQSLLWLKRPNVQQVWWTRAPLEALLEWQNVCAKSGLTVAACGLCQADKVTVQKYSMACQAYSFTPKHSNGLWQDSAALQVFSGCSDCLLQTWQVNCHVGVAPPH